MWVHEHVTKLSEKSIGIDISEEGVKRVREMGYKNVYHHDLMASRFDVIEKEHWDYMLLGEMIEHVDNPTDFLSNVKKKYSPYVDRIIITTPNAFRLDNFLFVLRNKECVNTDHRYWFTPYTLSKAVVRAGIEIETIEFTHGSVRPRKKLMNWFYERFPGFSMSLAAVGRF